MPLKKCDKASIPYCITTALTRAADGDTDNALLFCGENAWRLDHMTTVPELMAELAGEYLPDSQKNEKNLVVTFLPNNVTIFFMVSALKKSSRTDHKPKNFCNTQKEGTL